MDERQPARAIYRSAAEQLLHNEAMAALAAELQRDVSDVQPVYERAYLDLSGRAKVRDYLPLFVARRTRSTLLRR